MTVTETLSKPAGSGLYPPLPDLAASGVLQHFFERTADATPDRVALECAGRTLSYADLDTRANQLAHLLDQRGVRPGARVGLLLERSVELYVALLATLKAGATFIPIDPGFPADRVCFMAQDAAIGMIITQQEYTARAAGANCEILNLDAEHAVVSMQPAERRSVPVKPDGVCYIIYTSGSTGRPKGVAVSHAAICNFLSVATPVYGVGATDRVYQGMSISFDFSFEEIWPTWCAGATLVAGPTDSRRLGPGLGEFLRDNGITVLCCVPTLLATIDCDVPTVRTLLVGGEACPAELVSQWARPGRRLLNTYGPTEATVTATWTELLPGRQVTIGVPLPTYRVCILDESLDTVAAGVIGEICIGGPGIAIGYVNRDDVTAERFVPNPVKSDRDAPRLYRTGDLGRLTATGEIEYLGRIDGQVKIRGYRIELGEIEGVLRAEPAVENAVVVPLHKQGPVQELVGYVTLRRREDDLDIRNRLLLRLRHNLPPHMVPAFLEVLSSFPMLAADKPDRAALPAPVQPRLGMRSGGVVEPGTQLEARIAQAWCEVLGIDDVSVEDDFFCDLGGHSLAAALVVSRLRRDEDLSGLAIADLYSWPTIRALAQSITSGMTQRPDTEPRQVPEHPLRHSTLRVIRCGVAQFLAGIALVLAAVAPVGLLPMVASSPWKIIGLGVATGIWAFLISLLVPMTLGRMLSAGIRPGSYPLWGAIYFRWWLQRALIAASPLASLAGSPMARVYLRRLGGRIGRGAHLASVPAELPSLVDIGEGASIGYGVQIRTTDVAGGRLTIGRVSIGRNAFIGTNAVLMPGAEVGDDAIVGEQSLVAGGQRVPDSQRWAGSPGRRVEAADPLLDMIANAASIRAPRRRRAGSYLVALLVMQVLPAIAFLPSAALLGILVIDHSAIWEDSTATLAAGALYVLSVCVIVAFGKRMILWRTRPGIHPVGSNFGVRKWMSDRLMAMSLGATNTLYATLYAVPFLRLLGARIGKWSEVSTVAHLDPDMLVLGEETFVADIAALAPAVFHRGQIALGPVDVGSRAFVGNGAVIRAHTHLGANSLIGVHSVPPDHPVGPETSWLGSPAMFLPRRQQSRRFDDDLTYRPRAGRVAGRLAIELVRVVLPASIMCAAGLVFVWALWTLARVLPGWELALLTPWLMLGLGIGSTLIVAAMKWLVAGRYRPRVEPLWNTFVRRSELVTGLYETVAVPMLVGLFRGTPWIGPLLRLFGAHVGRRVWLDTTYLTEFDLVRIGDDAAVGSLTSLQTHLFEDRVMKMSVVRIEAGASVGPRSVVLYDSVVGAGTHVDALSVVMKGETLPAGTRWRGVPARALTRDYLGTAGGAAMSQPPGFSVTGRSAD
jgi:non-ribosomal peptide synthetase-like protein